MSKVELAMPSYGMADTESVVLQWLREPGDVVQEGEPLVEIETAKAQMSLEAPASGVVGPHLVAVDDEIATGTVLTWIEQES